MYVAILDRELKKASNFIVGKDYYVKNGNGNWYVGKLKCLDTWHTIDTSDGKKRVCGRSLDNYVGIHSEDKIFELNLNNKLRLPPFPESFIFGEEEIKTKNLTKAEIDIILKRWKIKNTL